VLRYVIRRLLALVLVVFGVTVAVFLMVRLIPGDVVTVLLGSEGVADPQRLALMRHYFGLDQPLSLQYAEWLGNLLHGDFGVSLMTGRPILPDVLARLPVTLQLTVMAMLLSLLVAVPAGILSAARPDSLADSAVRVAALIGLSVPNFWLATLLVLFVSLYWRVLPTSGYVPLSVDPLGSVRSLLLPALSLALPNLAIVLRMTRSSMLEVLRQEYIVTARSKGLRERLVIARHALRNALIPIVTVAGIQVGYLLGGAIVIEQIFALPGLGTLILGAITQRDYPLLQAGVLFIAVAFPLVNLVVDLLYAYLDPKIRYG